jgi:hypothetical protein
MYLNKLRSRILLLGSAIILSANAASAQSVTQDSPDKIWARTYGGIVANINYTTLAQSIGTGTAGRNVATLRPNFNGSYCQIESVSMQVQRASDGVWINVFTPPGISIYAINQPIRAFKYDFVQRSWTNVTCEISMYATFGSSGGNGGFTNPGSSNSDVEQFFREASGSYDLFMYDDNGIYKRHDEGGISFERHGSSWQYGGGHCIGGYCASLGEWYTARGNSLSNSRGLLSDVIVRNVGNNGKVLRFRDSSGFTTSWTIWSRNGHRYLSTCNTYEGQHSIMLYGRGARSRSDYHFFGDVQPCQFNW